jgi:hypothetical protein
LEILKTVASIEHGVRVDITCRAKGTILAFALAHEKTQKKQEDRLVIIKCLE